jgi:hypothetical protein
MLCSCCPLLAIPSTNAGATTGDLIVAISEIPGSLSLSLSLSVGMIPQGLKKSAEEGLQTTLTKPSEKLFQRPKPLDSIHPLQNFRL